MKKMKAFLDINNLFWNLVFVICESREKSQSLSPDPRFPQIKKKAMLFVFCTPGKRVFQAQTNGYNT